MARPQGYLNTTEDKVMMHAKIPKGLANWFHQNYGTDQESAKRNSTAKALTQALTELQALKA